MISCSVARKSPDGTCRRGVRLKLNRNNPYAELGIRDIFCSPDNADIRKQKRGEPFRFGRLASRCSALSGLQKISQFAKRTVALMADYDVIHNFDLHQLAGADQIAGDFDVGLRWRRVP